MNPPITSLRAWLCLLAESGRLALAREGLALRHELAALSKGLDGRQALFAARPDGHEIPVVCGLIGQRAWLAEAMGVGEAAMLEHFLAAAAAPLPCREVTEAPAQEVQLAEVDLTRDLPIPTHNEHDHGPYITAGLLITRNPKTGIQNVSIHRCQISGPRRIGILLLPRHAYRFHQMAEEAGEALPVAIVIGVDPLTLLASQAIVPIDHDELEIAGALHGRPLAVVRCRSNPLLVPAAAEIVIEGRLLPQAREPEGPFGEFPKYYGPRSDKPVIEVDVLTRRARPLFHTIVGGSLEHLLLGGIPREATLLAHLRRSFPSVLDVHLSVGGVCRYHLFVQIDKRHEGEAKNIICAAFAGHYDVKHVVVVDKDVDVHDPGQVEWALATRFQADRDLVTLHGAQSSALDPSAREAVGAKLGFDATVPLAAEPFRFLKIRIPGEDRLDLGKLLTERRETLADYLGETP